MDGPRAADRPALIELVEPSRWQRLQDHFACVLHTPMRTVSPWRELVTTPSWPQGVEVDRAIKALAIGEEMEPLIPSAHPPQELSSYTTPLGLTYAVVPVRMTPTDIVAYFVVGPIVVGPRENELQFRKRVTELGLDANILWPLILSLKLYTFAGIRSALTLIEEVGTAIVELAYQARHLSAILPATSRVDQAVVSYHSQRILHSLLEAAAMATRADGGSVMLYDPQRDAFQISVAQGLSDEVIATTSVKRGEGLVGLAAAERAILLVDDHASDARIKTRMGRRELVSSLVAPLMPDASQEPIGVLNLRTADPQRRFTQDHVELLRRLLDLAGIAMGNLRSIFQHARLVRSP